MSTMITGNAGRYNDIFASVFPQQDFSTPTPEATPEIGILSSPARPFGGPLAAFDVADEALKQSQAWSNATRYLSIQGSHSQTSESSYMKAYESLLYLISSPSLRSQLLDWYLNEIRCHFSQNVLPQLSAWQKPLSKREATTMIEQTLQIVEQAQSAYLRPFNKLELSGYHSALVQAFVTDTLRCWHTLLQHSIPRDRLQKYLSYILFLQLKRSLENNCTPDACLENGVCECKVDLNYKSLRQLSTVGFGGEIAERALAIALYKFLTGPAVERRCFQVDWSGGLSVTSRLASWVRSCFAPSIAFAQSALRLDQEICLDTADVDQQVMISLSSLGRSRVGLLFDYVKSWPDSKGAIEDVKSYIAMGQSDEKAYVCSHFAEQVRSRLLHAGASTTEVLSIYINAIHIFRYLDPRGVLLDKVAMPIRQYLRTREDTVSVIAASFLADWTEEDSIAAANRDSICVDIAIELGNAESEEASQDMKTLNWDDPNWTPDPIDAGPDFRSSRSEDVIGYILGLFEQEDFIKEVTNVLAGHLLQPSTDVDYARETRLVELMKARFDSGKLQAAEVMLKDVRDSVALNKKFVAHGQALTARKSSSPTPAEIQAAIPEQGSRINALYEPFSHRIDRMKFITALKLVANRRSDMWYPKRTRLASGPYTLHASSSAGLDGVKTEGIALQIQIVSSFFWPQMRSETFAMPRDLSSRFSLFETFFERVSGQRKLQLRPALGRVTVELELEDRTIREENVTALRASVLDAFADNGTVYPPSQEQEGDGGQQPVKQVERTADALATHLDMHLDLVQDSLNFWSIKNVLYQPFPGTHAVLERLDMLSAAVTGSAANAGERQDEGAIMTSDALFREQAPTFEVFILNMLKNGGPKEVGGMIGIASMLKMVLPIFTYGEEEAKLLLEDMERKGMVRRDGEVWIAT